MYICVCNAVTDGDIRAACARGARTLCELREETGVASCCGGCTEIAEGFLEERRPAAA